MVEWKEGHLITVEIEIIMPHINYFLRWLDEKRVVCILLEPKGVYIVLFSPSDRNICAQVQGSMFILREIFIE